MCAKVSRIRTVPGAATTQILGFTPTSDFFRFTCVITRAARWNQCTRKDGDLRNVARCYTHSYTPNHDGLR
jgi:hypothetical protein